MRFPNSNRSMKRRLAAAACMVLLALGWVLGVASVARADAVFSFEPRGGGVYVIRGVGLENLAALDFTIVYDKATLRDPQVTKGAFVPSDASFMANTAIAGEIRLLVNRGREMSGGGDVATVAFKPVSGMLPRIVRFAASPISVQAMPVNELSRVVNPLPSPSSDPPSQPDNRGKVEDQPRNPGGTVTGGTGAMVAGSITMPGDLTSMGERDKKKDGLPTPEPAVAPPSRAGDDRGVEPSPANNQTAPEKAPAKPVVVPSMLELFRNHRGERTPQALLALFARDAWPAIRQEPPVSLSDGVATVRVCVGSLPDTPTFSLGKARLVRLEPGNDKGWCVELLPEKGTNAARLTVFSAGGTVDFPLAVAPVVALPPGKAGIPGEADFRAFLADVGTGKAPRFDLNGDGVRNYEDDYLYAANYLALQTRRPESRPVAETGR